MSPCEAPIDSQPWGLMDTEDAQRGPGIKSLPKGSKEDVFEFGRWQEASTAG